MVVYLYTLTFLLFFSTLLDYRYFVSLLFSLLSAALMSAKPAASVVLIYSFPLSDMNPNCFSIFTPLTSLVYQILGVPRLFFYQGLMFYFPMFSSASSPARFCRLHRVCHVLPLPKRSKAKRKPVFVAALSRAFSKTDCVHLWRRKLIHPRKTPSEAKKKRIEKEADFLLQMAALQPLRNTHFHQHDMARHFPAHPAISNPNSALLLSPSLSLFPSFLPGG